VTWNPEQTPRTDYEVLNAREKQALHADEAQAIIEEAREEERETGVVATRKRDMAAVELALSAAWQATAMAGEAWRNYYAASARGVA